MILAQVIRYFLSLSSEAHSDAWTPVLLLLFTQLERLEAARLRQFSGPLYPLLCQLWCTEALCVFSNFEFAPPPREGKFKSGGDTFFLA